MANADGMRGDSIRNTLTFFASRPSQAKEFLSALRVGTMTIVSSGKRWREALAVSDTRPRGAAAFVTERTRQLWTVSKSTRAVGGRFLSGQRAISSLFSGWRPRS